MEVPLAEGTEACWALSQLSARARGREGEGCKAGDAAAAALRGEGLGGPEEPQAETGRGLREGGLNVVGAEGLPPDVFLRAP